MYVKYLSTYSWDQALAHLKTTVGSTQTSNLPKAQAFKKYFNDRKQCDEGETRRNSPEKQCLLHNAFNLKIKGVDEGGHMEADKGH